MPKEKCSFGIYIRTKEGTYAIIGDSEETKRKYKAMRKMTLGQIEFCDRMKSEFENGNYTQIK